MSCMYNSYITLLCTLMCLQHQICDQSSTLTWFSRYLLMCNSLNVGTANGKFTPSKGKPLAKHVHGEPTSGNFNHSSMFGMFLWLAGHTYPDITNIVNCAVWYMLSPEILHRHALKQTACYLKHTSDNGLIMKPSKKLLKIGSFPDTKFSEMYVHKAINVPVCVNSRTEYMIMVANSLIKWKFELQLRPF